jgi:hypothetical protein
VRGAIPPLPPYDFLALCLSTSITYFLPTSELQIHWVSGALLLGVKRPGREANHSPPSSAELNA